MIIDAYRFAVEEPPAAEDPLFGYVTSLLMFNEDGDAFVDLIQGDGVWIPRNGVTVESGAVVMNAINQHLDANAFRRAAFGVGTLPFCIEGFLQHEPVPGTNRCLIDTRAVNSYGLGIYASTAHSLSLQQLTVYDNTTFLAGGGGGYFDGDETKHWAVYYDGVHLRAAIAGRVLWAYSTTYIQATISSCTFGDNYGAGVGGTQPLDGTSRVGLRITKGHPRYGASDFTPPTTFETFGPPAVHSHRYWRFVFDKMEGSGMSTSCAELQFRTAVGGAAVNTGAMMSASTSYSGTSAANAADGNNSTLWGSASGAGVNAWLKMDYGSPVEIVEVAYRGRADGMFNQYPENAQIQWSDDNSRWNSLWDIGLQTGWSTGEQRVFTRPGF